MKNNDDTKRQRLVLAVIFCSAILFSIYTVAVQVREIGFDRMVEGGWQVQNLERDLSGTAGNPWQYRILSPLLVDGLVRAIKSTGLPFPSANAFFIFRFVQNLLIFVFAGYYYQKLGLNLYGTLIGLSLLAWGMSQALQDADLQFNTYTDVLFYMLAGLVVAQGNYAWIIPIILLAAFNRETSALIPLMPAAVCIQFHPRISIPRRPLVISAIALGVYAVAFFSLRYILFGPQELNLAYGNHMGVELFLYNVTRPVTWLQMFATLGLLPVLGILTLRRWPDLLRRLFWLIMPIWVVVHLFGAVMAETRLFLAPDALILIPGVLFGLLAQPIPGSAPAAPDQPVLPAPRPVEQRVGSDPS